jgi:hypothetical protein
MFTGRASSARLRTADCQTSSLESANPFTPHSITTTNGVGRCWAQRKVRFGDRSHSFLQFRGWRRIRVCSQCRAAADSLMGLRLSNVCKHASPQMHLLQPQLFLSDSRSLHEFSYRIPIDCQFRPNVRPNDNVSLMITAPDTSVTSH